MPVASLLLYAALCGPAAMAGPISEPIQDHPVVVRRFAHYCDWYTKCPAGGPCDSWSQASTIPFRHDALPGVGYDSMDPAVVRDHNREMWTNGIVPLISWWGPDAPHGGSAFVDLYLSQWDTQYPVKPGLLYEVLGRLKVTNGVVDFADPENAARFVADVRYLNERYWAPHPDRFFRLYGRPVLFIWVTEIFRGPFDDVLAQARQVAAFTVIGAEILIPGGPRPGLVHVVRGMDAVSHYGIYSPPLARQHRGHVDAAYVAEYADSIRGWSTWLQTNAPGVAVIPPLQFAFDDHLVPDRDNPPLTSTPAEARELASAARSLIQESLTACGNLAPFVLFTSYNEHFEGTAMEPNDRYGDDFLDILRETFTHPLTRPASCD